MISPPIFVAAEETTSLSNLTIFGYLKSPAAIPFYLLIALIIYIFHLRYCNCRVKHKPKPLTEGEVVYGQQEEPFTQVGSRNAKRDYVQRGSYQNQRGRRGSRRGGGGYPNGRGGRGGNGGYQNGRYESYDQSGGNGYQRNYYNNRGRGRGGGGGGNGHSYHHHQDSNVTAAS